MRSIVLIGFNNSVPAQRLVAVMSARGAAATKLRKVALAANKLLDARKGSAAKSLIVLDSDHVILSSIRPNTLVQRFEEALNVSSDKHGKALSKIVHVGGATARGVRGG